MVAVPEDERTHAQIRRDQKHTQLQCEAIKAEFTPVINMIALLESLDADDARNFTGINKFDYHAAPDLIAVVARGIIYNAPELYIKKKNNEDVSTHYIIDPPMDSVLLEQCRGEDRKSPDFKEKQCFFDIRDMEGIVGHVFDEMMAHFSGNTEFLQANRDALVAHAVYNEPLPQAIVDEQNAAQAEQQRRNKETGLRQKGRFAKFLDRVCGLN